MMGNAVMEPPPCAGVQPCGALQKAAVQVEHIAGIGFASRRTADEQRQGTVGDRVLAQVVIDDQHVLALIHEVFGHGAAGNRGAMYCRGESSDAVALTTMV